MNCTTARVLIATGSKKQYRNFCCGIVLVTHTGGAVAKLPWSDKPTANLSPARIESTDFTDSRIDYASRYVTYADGSGFHRDGIKKIIPQLVLRYYFGEHKRNESELVKMNHWRYCYCSGMVLHG